MSLLPFIWLALANVRQGIEAPERIIENRLQDVSMTIRIVRSDKDALRRIGSDFAALYALKAARVRIKEPRCLRVDIDEQGLQLCYVINGTLKLVRMPGLLQQQDLASSPGKLQSAFDLGLLTRSLFDVLYRADYVETEARTGLLVYDFKYRAGLDTSHSRVWVDPDRRIIVRRDWFDRENTLRGRTTYSEPVEVGGCWVPTKVELRDPRGRLAGLSIAQDIELNRGLPDALFR